MEEVRLELLKIRERMIIGMALIQALADVALAATPAVAAQLDNIVALGHGCVFANVRDVSRLIEVVSASGLAA